MMEERTDMYPTQFRENLRQYPEDEIDQEVADTLDPKAWQLDALRLNYEYATWDTDQFARSFEAESWSDFVSSFSLNDLNEVVTFVFEVSRKVAWSGEPVEDESRLDLLLWAILPRKNVSSGIRVKNIQQEDLPEIRAFLTEAAKRNQRRFEKAILPDNR